MNTPLVTIAIPIYNAEKYLRDAIQSCINQTYQNWELLLMCDGSTDSSTSIATEIAKNDDRIKVVNDDTNKGMVYRMNQSIQMARGKYYARMDADDIMAVDRIANQVEMFQAHPEYDVIGGAAMLINAENSIISSASIYGITNSFIHPTVMGRIEWYKNNQYTEWAVRAEDRELWMRTASHSTFYNMEIPLLFYREFGVPALSKTLSTLRTENKIYARYNEYGQSYVWFLKKYTFTTIKQWMYILFDAISLIDFILKRRKRVRVSEELCLNEMDLQKSINSK